MKGNKFNKKNLPEYEPGNHVWKNIANKLDQTDADHNLQSIIQKLPSYNPSNDVWSEIDLQLNHRPAKYISFLKYAASLILILGIGFTAYYLFQSNQPSTVNNHQTKINNPLFKTKNQSLNQQFTLIQSNYLNNYTTLPNKESFNILINQFHELDDLETTITNANLQFLNDPEIARKQMVINRKKAQIIKNLVQLIMKKA